MKPVWIKWLSGAGTLATFAFYLNYTQPVQAPETGSGAYRPTGDQQMQEESMFSRRMLADSGRIDDLETGSFPPDASTYPQSRPSADTGPDKNTADQTAAMTQDQTASTKTALPAKTAAPVNKSAKTKSEKSDTIRPSATPEPFQPSELSALDQLLAEMNASTPVPAAEQPLSADAGATAEDQPAEEWDPFAGQQLQPQTESGTRRSWRSSRS